MSNNYGIVWYILGRQNALDEQEKVIPVDTLDIRVLIFITIVFIVLLLVSTYQYNKDDEK